MDLENNKELRTGAVIVAAGHKKVYSCFYDQLKYTF